MRILVSEFLAGGAADDRLGTPSMRREGLAMLRAIVADLARIPGHSVVTTLKSDLNCSMPAEIVRVKDPREEYSTFQRLLGLVDAALIIAPETDGILADRCRQVELAGVASWNCTPAAIELCGDKFRLANHLEWHRIPTIRAQIADLREPPDCGLWPVVLKPRDGAGSNLTFLVQHAQDWDNAVRQISAAGFANRMILQPLISGRALSVGINIAFDGGLVDILPVGEQRISADGRFCYLGGRIPASISLDTERMIQDVVRAACESISGLAGYIGFDLILTEESRPVVVEINPRLTTAYIGYRQMFSDPLPKRWLGSERPTHSLSRSAESVEFDISELLNSV